MKRYVIIGLLLLIAGAVGLAFPLLTRKSTEAPAVVDTRIHYFCSQCRKEFTLAPQEFARQKPDMETVQKDRTAARRPNCPLCGAKHSGWMMVQCPKCGQWYLPPGAMPGSAAVSGQSQDVCPHCKTDRAAWYRSHPRG